MLVQKKSFRSIFFVALASLALTACASPASQKHSAKSQIKEPVQPVVNVQPVCPVVEVPACEPEVDLATEAALRKLALGNEWHSQTRYSAALEAYEAVLVENASLLADAYALWGIIALQLDRENPNYDRDKARTVAYVLDQRVRDAAKDEAVAEARLLWFSAQAMLTADVSKDNVVQENRKLRKELAEREEAIQRLRELTVGR